MKYFLTILKMTDLHKTGGFNAEEGEEEEDEDHIDEDPTIEVSRSLIRRCKGLFLYYCWHLMSRGVVH